jgi:chromosome segregation ATPase
MKFLNNIASKLGYISKDVSKEEINELNERLVTLDITYRNAQQERQELYDQYLGLKEENARLIEQGLEYQNQVRSLKSQLAAEEQERLAKDATLQQIRNILDRHYAM